LIKMVTLNKSPSHTTNSHKKTPLLRGFILFDKIRPSQYDEKKQDTDRNLVRIRNSFIPAV
ncbi:MAG: hypothetical protein II993_09375, partial [Anaerotignum sp.]|nr:hypothetical protein [Anaerotignum sp.]